MYTDRGSWRKSKAGRERTAELGGVCIPKAVIDAFKEPTIAIYQNESQYSNMIIIHKGNTSSLIHSTTFSTATVCTAVQFDPSAVD